MAVAEGRLILPEPIGKQPEWLDSPASKKVLRVGRRGSKTRFAFIASLTGHGPGWRDRAPTFPGVLQGWDVIWFAQTYTNLSTVLWHEEIVPRMGHLPWIKLNDTKHDVTVPGVGSLMLRSAEPEAIKSVRGAGKRLRGVIIDEAAWLALRAALLDIIIPALLDNDGWMILMSTTNEGKDGGYDDTGAPQIPSYFNVICQEIIDGKRGPDWEQFTGTAFDNPTLSPAAVQAMIDEYPPDSPQLKREVFAELLEVGVGLALPGIGERHICPAFSPPDHWTVFAGFDWAFYHNWVFGIYYADEDGAVYCRETVIGRLDLPDAIDAKVRKAGIDPKSVVIHAGPDVYTARQDSSGRIKGQFTGPTIAEQLQGMGWRLVPAANARVAGLNNLRQYTYIDPKRPDVPPRFRWMDTPGNRIAMAQVARMTLDPKNPEDALKVDADAAGRGGDDCYDSVRYGLMSRPIMAVEPPKPDQQGKSLGYDFEARKPRERETAESIMASWIGEKQSPVAGRYRVPQRRK